MDWFLYDIGLRRERVKQTVVKLKDANFTKFYGQKFVGTRLGSVLNFLG